MQSALSHPTIVRTMAGPARTITVAAAQIAARFMNEASATLTSIESAIGQAAARHADLLVLPECAYPAYLLGSVSSYRSDSHLSSEAFIEWLAGQALRHRLHLVCGFVEDTGTWLYNSAVLIDDQGREIGRARKRFLWHLDHDWYEPGGEIRAFDSRLGRLGMVICAETRVPEIVATLAADGAELLAMPTCWVNGSRESGRFTNPQVDFLIEARAREFALPFVCADKSGLEWAGVGYVGQSRIVRADGSIAAEAPAVGEMTIATEVRLERSSWHPPHARVPERITSTEPPVRPSVAEMPSITLAALPGRLSAQHLGTKAYNSMLESLRRLGVDVLMGLTNGDHAAEAPGPREQSFGIQTLAVPWDDASTSIGPARMSCLPGSAAKSFIAARVLALNGTALMVFYGDLDSVAVLRTRAAENRIFVVAIADRAAMIVGPDGAILSSTTADADRAAIARVALAETASKLVAPKTDIFAGRQPHLYHF